MLGSEGWPGAQKCVDVQKNGCREHEASAFVHISVAVRAPAALRAARRGAC